MGVFGFTRDGIFRPNEEGKRLGELKSRLRDESKDDLKALEQGDITIQEFVENVHQRKRKVNSSIRRAYAKYRSEG